MTTQPRHPLRCELCGQGWERDPATPAEIRHLRKCLSLTRRELASRLGVSYGAIASWEAPEGRADHRTPSGPALRLLGLLRAEAEARERETTPPEESPAPRRRGRPRKKPV